jgi:LL-diaminopimelate aminotransferase
MRLASRLTQLPPYLFAELDRKTELMRSRGVDVITFGIGDPDLPTPGHIVEACCEAARDPVNHRYPSYEGMPAFREAVAQRVKEDKGIEVDPDKEVIALIGSKEGIHNIHFALVEKGDVVLYTDPGYPVYRTGAIFAGARPFPLPLREERNFLPDLEAVPDATARKARILWLNYPNNPTTGVADREFYREVLDFARDNDIVVCSDEAYSRFTFDGYRAVSLLEVEGGMDAGIVFDSLSKTYNMTGWRIAYALGNQEVIGALKKVKTNVDSGVPQIIQRAGIAALTSSQDCVEENLRVYRERRDVMVGGLKEIGLECSRPKATFYLWLKVPDGDSMKFADTLLEEAGVVCTPGVGFGEYGEGYVRFALTQPVERIREALERMEKVV